MLIWTCSDCGTENSETGTCSNCGHVASKAELAHARQLIYTRHHFPRGLPALTTSVGLSHFLSTVLILAGILLLVAMVPGAAVASAIPPAGSASSVAISKRARVTAYVFTVHTSRGLSRLLDPGLSGRTYLLHSAKLAPQQVAVAGPRYALTRAASRHVGAVRQVGQPGAAQASRGYILRTVRGYTLETMPAVTSAGPTRIAFKAGKTQKVLSGRAVSIDTPLRSSSWSAGQLLLGAVLLGVVGYLTTGRMAARHLAATVTAMVVASNGLRIVELFTIRLIGNLATRPDYPAPVVYLAPFAAAVILAVVVVFIFRFTNVRLYFLTRHPEVTASTWFAAKLVGTVCVPLIVYVIVRGVDTFIACLFPGLTL